MNPQESTRTNAPDPSDVQNRTDATTIATNFRIDRSEENLDHLIDIGKTETEMNQGVASDESIRINRGTMMPPPLPPIINQDHAATAFASQPPPPQYHPNYAQYPPVIPYAAPPFQSNYVAQYPPVITYAAPPFQSNYLMQYPPVPQYAAPSFQSNYIIPYQHVLPFMTPAFPSNCTAQMPHATLPSLPTQTAFLHNNVTAPMSATTNPPFATNGTIPVSLVNGSEPWSSSCSASKETGRPVPKPWEKRLAQLAEFKAKHGHCEVPQRYSLNPELGRWVKDQRTLKTKGTLSQERIDKLEELGFNWKVKSTEISWEKHFNCLVSYKEIHGDCNMGKGTTDDMKLVRWVDRQRQAKKNGKLSEERLEKLNNLGFIWSVR